MDSNSFLLVVLVVFFSGIGVFAIGGFIALHHMTRGLKAALSDDSLPV